LGSVLALDFKRRCSLFFRFVLARLSRVKGLTGVNPGKMLLLLCSFPCSTALALRMLVRDQLGSRRDDADLRFSPQVRLAVAHIKALRKGVLLGAGILPLLVLHSHLGVKLEQQQLANYPCPVRVRVQVGTHQIQEWPHGGYLVYGSRQGLPLDCFLAVHEGLR